MIESESAKLLAVLAAYDRRTVGDVDVQVWSEQMKNYRLVDAVDAAHRHYSTSSEWLDPNRLRRLITALRNDRLERVQLPCPPYELANDPVGTIEWLADWRRRVADGETPEQIEGTRRMPAIEGTFRAIPPSDGGQ